MLHYDKFVLPIIGLNGEHKLIIMQHIKSEIQPIRVFYFMKKKETKDFDWYIFLCIRPESDYALKNEIED